VSVVRDNAGNVPSAIVPLLTHYACSASYTRVARRAALRGLAALGADAADAAAHVLTLAESTVDEATMALDVLAQIGPTIAPQCLARLTVIVRAEDFRSVAALCAFAALAPHELPTLLPNESLGSRDLSGLILHEGINRPRHYGGRGLADAGYRLALVKAMEQWVEATIVAIQLDGHDRVHVGWGRAKCMWALERLADLEATESLATCLRSAFPVCAMYYHQELTELWGRYGEQSSHAAWTNMRSDELTQGDM